MKKGLLVTLIVLLFLAGAGWAAATWVIGTGSEGGFEKSLNDMNAQFATVGLRLERESFQRGFLTSEGIVKIDVPSPMMTEEDADKGLRLKAKIWHGPLMFTPDGPKAGFHHLELTMVPSSLEPDLQASLEEALGGEEDLFVVKTWSGLDGKVSAAFTVAPLSWKEEGASGKGKMEFSGASGTLTGLSEKPGGKGEIVIGSLKGSQPETGFNAEIAESRMELDVAPGASEHSNGTGYALYELPSVKISESGNTYFVQNVSFRYDMDEDAEGRMEAGYTFKVGKVTAPETSGFPVAAVVGKGGTFTYGFKGVRPQEVEAFNEALRDLQTWQMNQMAEGNLGAAMEGNPEKTEAVAKTLLSLFQPGLSLSASLLLQGAQGNAKATLELAYTADKPLSEQKTLGDTIRAFGGEISFRMSKAILPPELAMQVMAVPLQSGFIVEDATEYKGEFQLAQGETTLNGQEVPLLESFGPALEEEIPWDDVIRSSTMGGLPLPGGDADPTGGLDGESGSGPMPGEPGAPASDPAPDFPQQ